MTWPLTYAATPNKSNSINDKPALPDKCVQIYYDRINPNYFEGRSTALILENLLAHFPNIQRYVIPIEMYKQGQLDRCYASFYVSTINNDSIPNLFLQDYANTKKNVIWMQHNIWKLDAKILQKIWMAKFNSLAFLDWDHKDKQGHPGFFRYYQYKGQEFTAYGEFDENNSNKFTANYFIVQMMPLNDDAKKYVVSWVKHSTNNQLIPFILHNANHWYVTQLPFSYMTKDSQYLIFTDLLFDMIGEQPRYKGKKPALVRIEDVNTGFTTPEQLIKLSDIFFKYRMPFSIALIPIFADPFKVLNRTPGPITHNYGFVYALHYAKDHGGSIIYGGVTHQYDNMKNPYNGMSGADYEFWDMVNDQPLKEDSPHYILDKLQQGADVIAEAGLKPVAWLTPHYRASILDYFILAQVFNWSVESKYYVPYTSEQKIRLPESLTFDNDWPGSVAIREPYFKSLKVNYPKSAPFIQPFFPFEIYGDSYGQRVIPENVGYITPKPQLVDYYETVDGMIATVQRNAVLRDVWASFFIHPFLLNTKDRGGMAEYRGDSREIERLLVAIEAAGYQFIDLTTWTKEHMEMAPKTIEVTFQ